MGAEIKFEVLREKSLSETFKISDSCNSTSEAQTCRSKCDTDYRDCIIHCSHSISCAESCINDTEECISFCPCYGDCPNGCPCPHYTVWCPDESCQRKNEISFDYCINENEETFIQCTFSCSPFDIVCHQNCTEDYTRNLTKCPCGELCPDGCPCSH